MKVQSVFFSLPKLFFVLSFLVFLSSCSSYTQQANRTKSEQMGDRILSALNNHSDESEPQLAEIISQLTALNDTSNLTDVQINTSVELYKEGLLFAVGNENFERLSLLKTENQSVKNQKVQTLFTLFPNHAKSIATNLTKYRVYDVDELLELAVSNNLDPSTILHAPAAGENPDIMRIGWGGSGAFSSVVEYNGDIYASSDVTGVWKYNGYGWDPLVEGLTNYNITGLLVHNDTLLAATKNQILMLENNAFWSPIGLQLRTYRNKTLQLHSTSTEGITCFAALEPRLACIDTQGNVSKKPLSISQLKGVYFSDDNDYLYGFAGKNLYKISRFDGEHSLEYTFPNDILRIAKVGNDSEPLIFTQKGVYELNSFAAVNLDLNNKSIINVLIDSSAANQHFIAMGRQFSAALYELDIEANGLSIGSKVPVNFDNSLPYRQWRKTLTTPIGSPQTVKGNIWFGDYRGIYKYDEKSAQFYEKSLNASNFVGTDIHIDNEKLYIASMDNGLVSMELKQPNNFKSIFPRKPGDWLLAGHAWSVDSNEDGIFASLSPWNLSQDYLITADSNDIFLNVQKIDNLESRIDADAFWGQSYSRKLVVSDDIFVYKDGVNGGLFKLSYSADQDNSDIQETTSEKLFATERNRVYRALAQYNDFLVSYHIDDEKHLYFNDINSGELVKAVEAPAGLWAFDLRNINGALYLLGSQGSAVIYKFNEADETFTEMIKVPTASAFLSMEQSGDRSITIAGAVNWGGIPNGKVLLKTQDNKDWIDMTCLMANNSGVVDIEFTSDAEFVYLLQQVGSVIKLRTSVLKAYQGC